MAVIPLSSGIIWLHKEKRDQKWWWYPHCQRVNTVGDRMRKTQQGQAQNKSDWRGSKDSYWNGKALMVVLKDKIFLPSNYWGTTLF